MLLLATVALCLLGRASALPSVEGPCDILAAAGNPCVAAHSTVRSLFGSFAGNLYQVARPNNETADVGVLEAGGFADVAAHDKFCAAGECVIKKDLRPIDAGQPPRAADQQRCRAQDGQRIVAPDHCAGRGGGLRHVVRPRVRLSRGQHHRGGKGQRAVMRGHRYNEHCCFDYGNSENTQTAGKDYGCGAMEAIYFGDSNWVAHPPWTAPDGNRGRGNGPWVGADLEAGMYYGGGNRTRVNEQNTPLTSEFVSLSLKGRSDGFTLKGGDATEGAMKTMYDGPRPDKKIAGDCGDTYHYQPMRKQGAIILATGGDNSNGAEGNFYEGFMASGYASDATDEAIQANIIAVGYRAAPARVL